MPVFSVDGREPVVADSAWVATSATVVGDVTLDESVGIWYGSVLRADLEAISVGPRSNIQDGSVLHADPEFPVSIGAGVSVGHRAVLHGCTVEDDVLVGMGAIVLNGALVGRGSLVGAGALIPQGATIPPDSLVLGSPGRVVRSTTEDERARIVHNARHYEELLAVHRAAG